MDDPEEAAKKKQRKELDAAYRTAKMYNDRTNSALASFHTIMGNISNDPSWSWAEGKEKEFLMEKKLALDSFQVKSAFWKDWTLMDTMTLKKRWDAGEAGRELLGLQGLLEVLASLEKQVKKMTAMHNVAIATD